MTVSNRLLGRTVLALALSAPIYACAGAQDDLLAALDAYRANDTARLGHIAASMPADPLQGYPAYWLTLKALDKNDDTQASSFLARNPPGYTTDRIRREWLKKLGKAQNWATFESEWNKLPAESRDEETQCYGDQLTLRQGRLPANIDRFLAARPLPDGCNSLIATLAQHQLVSQDWLWQRLRLLLSGNYATQAKQLAASSGLPFDPTQINMPGKVDPSTRGGQEILLYSIEIKGRTNPQVAATSLTALNGVLNKSTYGFAWGQLALQAARRQQMPDALQWFASADKTQLNNDQWEWWARAALRQGDWDTVRNVIQSMPKKLAAEPAWQYWLARAQRLDNKPAAANELLAHASQDRGYYGLLAREELGNALSPLPDRTAPSDADADVMQKTPAVVRALELFDLAESARKPELRADAQNEWRWAMRGRTDMQLLAASEIARKAGFYDMAIYSAERTREQHDYSLRYLTPYREVTQRYAKQLGIDEAWIYGLIRQESRFATVAQSGVGASGLMQLMPKTARWVAQKMGLSNTMAVNDIETNIQLGTWYLKYVLDKLSDNEVLATAAYNAGPSRARAWQGSQPMDGIVYAETIPFSETRSYVQKVMANAAYYASTMGHNGPSLRNRMGVIPARDN
jgi:soluble lytic murein transglycosylase